MKKIFTVFTALFLAFQSVCSAYSDVEDSSLQDKLNMLSEMSIISGYEDGSFRPDSSITRAEFAKVIMSAIIVDSSVSDEKAFDDTVGHWSEEYVLLARHFSIINGMTDRIFEPNANVTYEQAIKMIVAAIGYNDEAQKRGGYSQGYISVAEELGITNGIMYRNADTATRKDVAEMVYNSLQVPFYFLTFNDGLLEYDFSESSLLEIFNMQKITLVAEETEEDYLEEVEETIETEESVG